MIRMQNIKAVDVMGKLCFTAEITTQIYGTENHKVIAIAYSTGNGLDFKPVNMTYDDMMYGGDRFVGINELDDNEVISEVSNALKASERKAFKANS